MTELAEVTTPTIADIARLYTMQEELAKLKSAEAMLRRRIFDHFFPDPTEGSKDNKYPLNDGTGAILQADYKINRTVLEADLDLLKKDPEAPKLPYNKLIKYEPKLVKAEYNKLTNEERKVFDRALDIKPGMPDVKVVIPKRA
jgi:hypothetical protein